jgi:hypothetical protein
MLVHDLPAPSCPDCGSAQAYRLKHADALLSLSIFYYRCPECSFVWVIDHSTGVSRPITQRGDFDPAG